MVWIMESVGWLVEWMKMDENHVVCVGLEVWIVNGVVKCRVEISVHWGGIRLENGWLLGLLLKCQGERKVV